MTPDEADPGSGSAGAGTGQDWSGDGPASVRDEVPRPVTLSWAEPRTFSQQDDAIMARFVRDYLGLLDERVATITAELESGNELTAHISLLSLESTSSMVGAKELAGIAGLLRGAVERKQRSVVPGLVQAMTMEAVKVHQRLGRPD